MTTGTDSHQQPPDLRDYLRVLRARKLQIALIALLVVGATLFFTARQTPIYEGRARVLVRPVQSATGQILIQEPPNLGTESELLQSNAVAEKVRQEVSADAAARDLLEELSVDVVTNTEVLLVRYAHQDPAMAARLANLFATAYVEFRGEQALLQLSAAQSAVQAQIDSVQEELTSLRREIQRTTAPPQRDALEAQRDTQIAQLGVLQQRLLDLQASASVNQRGAAEVIQPAEAPSSPVSPNVVRNGVLALFAGLALGVGFAFLQERLDDRIKSRQEVERRLGAPLIAAVPRIDGGKRNHQQAHLVVRTDPRSAVSEAYRTLGTNVQYLARQDELNVIMMTSALGGEGKTTTSANLAVVLAQAGKRVILVSADLRRPRAHTFFGLRNEHGLSDVLQGEMTTPDVVQDPQMDNLRLIASGPMPQNPAAVLGTQATAHVLESLRAVADFVLVDTAPVLAVADASILAPMVDAVILVIDAERSSRAALGQARDQMENAGATIIGAVFNNFDPTRGGYSPYYYHSYYYQYNAADDGRKNGSRARRRGRRKGRRERPAESAPWESPVEAGRAALPRTRE